MARTANRSPETVVRRYTFKLYPTRRQDELLREQSRMMAMLWNAALEERESYWRRQCQKYGAWETETYVTSKGEQKDRKRRKSLTAMQQALSIKQLRHEDLAWSAINADTPARVLFLLDDAFNAFFRRAKQGAGASSGYPRYKRVADGMSIPFREMSKGWLMKSADEIAAEAAMGRFSPRARAQTLHKHSRLSAYQVEAPADCGVSERQAGDDQRGAQVEAPADCGVSERRSSHSSARRTVEAPADCGVSESCQDDGRRIDRVETPAGHKKTTSRSWRIHVHGLCDRRDPSTWIKARGCFPQRPDSIRDCNIFHRDGAWWLSVAVRTSPQRIAGDDRVTITFDLIDEFARVERAKGRSPACSKEQTIGQPQQLGAGSGAATAETSGSEKVLHHIEPIARGAATAETSGSEKGQSVAKRQHSGAATAETLLSNALALEHRADSAASERDRRYRKRSWRWQRESSRVARLKARAKRIRNDALHRWSNEVVVSALDITIIIPDVKAEAVSPHGNAREWGASVETVSKLNRNTLNQAPALARQMLEYKAAEAGIRCDVIEHAEPKIAVGRDLVAAGKIQRRAKRQLKKSM